MRQLAHDGAPPCRQTHPASIHASFATRAPAAAEPAPVSENGTSSFATRRVGGLPLLLLERCYQAASSCRDRGAHHVGGVQEISLKDAGTHRFRHTLATRLLARGVGFEEIADILGNTPEIVRKHYANESKGRQDRIDELILDTSARFGKQTQNKRSLGTIWVQKTREAATD